MNKNKITKKNNIGGGKVSKLFNKLFRNARSNCKGGNSYDLKLLEYHGSANMGITNSNFKPKLGQKYNLFINIWKFG